MEEIKRYIVRCGKISQRMRIRATFLVTVKNIWEVEKKKDIVRYGKEYLSEWEKTYIFDTEKMSDRKRNRKTLKKRLSS